MRPLILLLVIGLFTFSPLQVLAQGHPVPPTGATPQKDWVYPLVLGGGAIAGVLVANFLTSGSLGLGTVRAAIRAPAAAPAAESPALGRVYAVTGAVVGGWVANWLYTGQ